MRRRAESGAEKEDFLRETGRKSTPEIYFSRREHFSVFILRLFETFPVNSSPTRDTIRK